MLSESINNQDLKTLVGVFEGLQNKIEVKEHTDRDNIISALSDYDEAIKVDQPLETFNSNGDSEDDVEIYNDTLKKLESGTDVSRNNLINAIRSFQKFKLPEFKKENIQKIRAPIMFHGTYISAVAMNRLNKEHRWGISWRAGFLVADNAELIAIKFNPKKNKNKYHLNQIEEYLRKYGKKSGVKRKYHFGSWQVLKGYACKPIYPDINDITPSGQFNFIGK